MCSLYRVFRAPASVKFRGVHWGPNQNILGSVHPAASSNQIIAKSTVFSTSVLQHASFFHGRPRCTAYALLRIARALTSLITYMLDGAQPLAVILGDGE